MSNKLADKVSSEKLEEENDIQFKRKKTISIKFFTFLLFYQNNYYS